MHESAEHLTDIAKVIQLSIAPVFLLTAIGTLLNVLSNRLARVVDRGRRLTEKLSELKDDALKPPMNDELQVLIRRRALVNRAITFGTAAALLVCFLIATAFLGAMLQLNVSYLLAAVFLLVLAAFVVMLVQFLREVLLASTDVHFDHRIT
jgi:hypothetical protein